MFIIQETSNTPKVEIHHSSGTIRIIGRSYPEHPANFYEPVNDDIENITSDDIDMYFDFDYINTASAKCILFFIKNVISKWDDVKITWVYEEGDDDIMELGEDYSDLIDIPFYFIKKVEK
jgi:hypothetical protein